jgi:FRG domain
MATQADRIAAATIELGPKDTLVKSWDELQHELLRGSWDEQLKRYRTNFAFRGVSDYKYRLPTSLSRLENPSVERHLIRNFRKYADPEFERMKDEWHWLSLGQHHGLPTRLLDWTYSPHVALHFATSETERYNAHGAIWCLNYLEARRRLPKALQNILFEEGSFVFTTELLYRFAKSVKEFDEKAKETTDEDFVLLLEPPSFDSRIVNQFGLFSMMSSPAIHLHSWLDKHPDLDRRLVISAHLKLEIRDKLDQSNITERVLYGGLDGLSSWLKRHYAPLGLQHGRAPPSDKPESDGPA